MNPRIWKRERPPRGGQEPGDDRSSGPAAAVDASWPEDYVAGARLRGAMPYVVAGFLEINDAVRRGHPVLLRRRRCDVADGITVFNGVQHVDAGQPVVTVLRFDPARARFVLRDGGSAVGAVELTPKRLARYLERSGCGDGIALGA